MHCDACMGRKIVAEVEFPLGSPGANCAVCGKYFPRPGPAAPEPVPSVPIAEQYAAIRNLMKKPHWW